jgi:hypothetical protein
MCFIVSKRQSDIKISTIKIGFDVFANAFKLYICDGWVNRIMQIWLRAICNVTGQETKHMCFH